MSGPTSAAENKRLWTHSKWVSLFPGDREAPWCQPHLVRQWLRDNEEHKGNVCYWNHRGDQGNQAVAILSWQVGANGRTGDQTGCKRGRNLRRQSSDIRTCRTELKITCFYSWQSTYLTKNSQNFTCFAWSKKTFVQSQIRARLGPSAAWKTNRWAADLKSCGAEAGYQSVGGAPLLLLGDVSHISEDHGESHSKYPRQRNQSKVAPIHRKHSISSPGSSSFGKQILMVPRH